MGYDHVVYLKHNGGTHFSIITNKGKSIYDFQESSRYRAMLVATAYCSSWNSICVMWCED